MSFPAMATQLVNLERHQGAHWRRLETADPLRIDDEFEAEGIRWRVTYVKPAANASEAVAWCLPLRPVRIPGRRAGETRTCERIALVPAYVV